MLVDLELVSITDSEGDAGVVVTFDATYPGETWVRSAVDVSRDVVLGLEAEGRSLVSTARDALLGVLEFEPAPVSFYLRLSSEGIEVVSSAPYGRA
jgi:hypothetical protein